MDNSPEKQKPTINSIKERLNNIRNKGTNINYQSPNIENQNREKLNLFSIKNISNEEVNELNNNIENIKSEFSKVTNENNSKDKFGYFIKQANEMIKNYEQQILYYKKKLLFYNSKDLIISSNIIININPSKKEIFDNEIKSIIGKLKEENINFQTLQKIYEKKIENLYAENKNLSKVINKLSSEVVSKLQKEISDALIDLKKEKKKNEDLEKRLSTVDGIFQQISNLKDEIKEKDSEISELNQQQIEHMNQIEKLSNNVKKLNDSIKLMNLNITEKEKIINTNSIKIQELSEKIFEKEDIIKKNEEIIQEKENEIQLLYSDNIQWEEKYSIQSQEIENFKKWSLWDQNLIESFKKIEKLDNELKEEKNKNTKLIKENNHIKNVNSEYSSNIEIMNNEIKNLKNEKEELILMKIEYEKEKNVIKNYYIMKDEYEKGKKEIINLKEKYDNQIISERKNYDDTIKQIKEKSENELNEQKKNYEKIIKENSDKDNREIKELKDKISYQEKSIQIYKNENESYKNEISKKSDMFKNLKEIYENLISKVKEQENKLQKYENPKNKSLLMDSLIGNSENEKNENEEKNNNNINDNENNSLKQYSTFDKFSFTKEILVDYILCLYLSENGITLQNIISNIMGNLNLFLSISFKDDIDEDTFNNYTNFPNKTIEQELIEDIFFLCFDKLITKKIIMNGEEILKSFQNPESLLKKYDKNISNINFEDFDSQTITEICYSINSKNFITRIKTSKKLEDLIKMFISKYEKKFDFETKLSDYIDKEIFPLVNKKLQNYNKVYFNEIRTLVELILHNLKNGKIYFEDKEVYSFERYFMQYNNYISLTDRNLKLDIFNNILKTEEIDNICHILKFYNPLEISFVNCFKDICIKNGESSSIQQNLRVFYQTYGIKNAINSIFSSIILFRNNLISFTFKQNQFETKNYFLKVFDLIKLLNNLENLDLSENNLNDENMKSFVQALKTNKSIKSLNLSKNSITSNGAFYLAELLNKNETLENLNISNNNINDTGLNSLFNTLSSNGPNLLELDLSYNNLKKENFSSLSDYLSLNPKLKILNLSGNLISPQSANIIGVTFNKNTNLNIIKVNKCGFNEESISNFIFYLNDSNISELELNNNSFGVMGPIIIMGKFKSCASLKKFSLQNCEVSSLFLNMIAENTKFSSNIEEVNLKNNEFDEKNFNNFCKSIENNTKTIFRFSKDKVPSLDSQNKNIILE